MASGDKPVLAILGGTGRVGAWLTEMALEQGYTVRALSRRASKMDPFKEKGNLEVIEGGIADVDKIKDLLEGAQVVISTLGSPNQQTLIMKQAAESLCTALKQKYPDSSNYPRIIWLTSTGINEATKQANQYGCNPCCQETPMCPSCWLCCGYGCFGCMQMCCLVPCVIGQDLWDDMGHSETVIRNHPDIEKVTSIVRPCNMDPVLEAGWPSEEWRNAPGPPGWSTRTADEGAPNWWIGRVAIAKFLLSLVHDNRYDGEAISIFRGTDGLDPL